MIVVCRQLEVISNEQTLQFAPSLPPTLCLCLYLCLMIQGLAV